MGSSEGSKRNGEIVWLIITKKLKIISQKKLNFQDIG